MSLFVTTWVAIGLYFCAMEFLFLKNTGLLDIMISGFIKQSGYDDTKNIRKVIIVTLASLWIIAWPLMIIMGKY